MKTFEVTVQRYISEQTTVSVEATDEADAHSMAIEAAGMVDNWDRGESCEGEWVVSDIQLAEDDESE